MSKFVDKINLLDSNMKAWRLVHALEHIQGGQMKSGQILSHNNSKTVLNIVFKIYTLVTEYISC
jgi:hypothetical protein